MARAKTTAEKDAAASAKAEDELRKRIAEELPSRLLEMELIARRHGHSIPQIIAKAAKDQYGIDIMPPPVVEDEGEETE